MLPAFQPSRTMSDLAIWPFLAAFRHTPSVVMTHPMDSSVSPTYGDQEGTAYNGHFACTCYHPLFVFNLGVYLTCAYFPRARVRRAPTRRARSADRPAIRATRCRRLGGGWSTSPTIFSLVFLVWFGAHAGARAFGANER